MKKNADDGLKGISGNKVKPAKDSVPVTSESGTAYTDVRHIDYKEVAKFSKRSLK
jgi:hypothetical protein